MWEWLSEGFRETYGEARIVCKGYIREGQRKRNILIGEEEGNMASARKTGKRKERSGENLETDPGQRE